MKIVPKQPVEEPEVVQTPPAVKNKDWEIGSEGNLIEPIDGEQITDEVEMEKQFVHDFGDLLEGFDEDDEQLDQILTDNQIARQNAARAEANNSRQSEIVTPDGIVINPQDVEIPLEKGQQKQEPAVKKSASPPPVEDTDLENYVPVTQYEELKANFDKLQGEFNSLKEKANDNMLGISKEEYAALRRIKYDYENSPLGVIVQDYYEGKFDANKFVPTRKSPQDFMPDDEAFDVNESFTPGTLSYEAREAFEEQKGDVSKKYKQIQSYLEENIYKKSDSTPEEVEKAMKEADDKLLDDLVERIPQAEKHRETLAKWLASQPNIYVVAWYTYQQALQNAIRAKKGAKPQPKPSTGSLAFSQRAPEEFADTADEELFNQFGD